jgi:2-phosphosulfolactate phosphatase
MKTDILQLISGAAQARGLTVVIDVFRAFSLVCYLFDRGATKIIAVRDVERALQLRPQYPHGLLVGERHALKIPGFDYGNSPSEIEFADLAGRTIIHTTHAGTAALVAAVDAQDVITGSFVNAAAIVRYIRAAAAERVSLVCAGLEGVRQTLEDTLAAEYLRDRLQGRQPNFDKIRQRIIRSECSRRFRHPTDRTGPERDLHLCLDLDRFDFVVRRTRMHDGLCVLERLDS